MRPYELELKVFEHILCNDEKTPKHLGEVMTEKMVNFEAQFFKALSNPMRIRIVDELKGAELSVSEISARLNIELPNLSQQLSVLRAKNIVGTRKHGNNIYYSCKDRTIFRLLDVAKEIFHNHLADIEETLKDIR